MWTNWCLTDEIVVRRGREPVARIAPLAAHRRGGVTGFGSMRDEISRPLTDPAFDAYGVEVVWE